MMKSSDKINMRKKCSILIIGAGPAGASLAWYLACQGIDAILIDRKKAAGSPVRCAEYVPSVISRLYDIPIAGVDLITSSMSTFIDYREEKTTRAPGFMLDRKRFSSWLIESFQEKGGKYINQAKAVSFNEEKGHISTTVISKGSQIHISSRFVAGADGPDSVVGKYIRSINEGFVLGLNENIPVEARDKERTMVFFSPEIPGGYGWLFPRGKSINLGIGCEAPYDRVTGSLGLKGIYREFKNKIFSMDFIKVGNIRDSVPQGKITAGLIPSSGMVENPARGRFILAGDAAGLSNPITGAGIYNAVLSADIISRIILEAPGEDDPGIANKIKEEYDSTFGISLSRASARRNILLSKWPESIRDGQDFSALIKDTWVAFTSYWKK